MNDDTPPGTPVPAPRDPTSARFDAERQPKPPTAPQPTEAEIGGPKGLEPTRYGDWTVKGRCIDF